MYETNLFPARTYFKPGRFDLFESDIGFRDGFRPLVREGLFVLLAVPLVTDDPRDSRSILSASA